MKQRRRVIVLWNYAIVEQHWWNYYFVEMLCYRNTTLENSIMGKRKQRKLEYILHLQPNNSVENSNISFFGKNKWSKKQKKNEEYRKSLETNNFFENTKTTVTKILEGVTCPPNSLEPISCPLNKNIQMGISLSGVQCRKGNGDWKGLTVKDQ